MISVPNIILEERLEENYFSRNLQTPLTFVLGKRVLRQGRLIIFKRSHYFFQLTISNSKCQPECFDIPLPFKVEHHPEENLLYFDYRIKSLAGSDEILEKNLLKQTGKTNPSQFFNKILEIQSILTEFP